MAGLSSIMAITRPLGEVDLAAMNRCTGVYRVYLSGGGGGGGGFQEWYEWYGGAGSNGVETLYTGNIVPPITLSVGTGGSAGSGATETGKWGIRTTMDDLRSSGYAGNLIEAAGGAGGDSANIRKSIQRATVLTRYGKVTSRFTVSFSHINPGAPLFVVTTGRGGDSMQSGNAGGIIKAFRIG